MGGPSALRLQEDLGGKSQQEAQPSAAQAPLPSDSERPWKLSSPSRERERLESCSARQAARVLRPPPSACAGSLAAASRLPAGHENEARRRAETGSRKVAMAIHRTISDGDDSRRRRSRLSAPPPESGAEVGKVPSVGGDPGGIAFGGGLPTVLFVPLHKPRQTPRGRSPGRSELLAARDLLLTPTDYAIGRTAPQTPQSDRNTNGGRPLTILTRAEIATLEQALRSVMGIGLNPFQLHRLLRPAELPWKRPTPRATLPQ